MRLKWDQTGERRYETGVDHGVLYIPDNDGVYQDGVSWNGLTTVTESPSGAEPSPQYADNMKYLNLLSAEEFSATIEALTYPDEFEQCDGTAEPVPGITIGQQPRKTFGFSYRTLLGNDTQGTELGYKLHLVYGCLAAPSEKARATVNDSPEAMAFSWEVSTTAVEVGVVGGKAYKPTSHLVIDSTEVDADDLAALEDILYGTNSIDPSMPSPAEVFALVPGTLQVATVGTAAGNTPQYNAGTHVVTLPSVTGVTWKINGVTKSAGAQPAMSSGQVSTIEANPAPGYRLSPESDDSFVFQY